MKYSKPRRIAALLFLALMLFIPVLTYLTTIDRVALWLVAWLVVWGLFLFLPATLETRGFLFLSLSLAVSLLGSSWVTATVSTEHKSLIGLLSQFMLVTGGGVGANFVAAGMLKFEENTEKNRSSKKT